MTVLPEFAHMLIQLNKHTLNMTTGKAKTER